VRDPYRGGKQSEEKKRREENRGGKRNIEEITNEEYRGERDEESKRGK
jgi:hypothetical protein